MGFNEMRLAAGDHATTHILKGNELAPAGQVDRLDHVALPGETEP